MAKNQPASIPPDVRDLIVRAILLLQTAHGAIHTLNVVQAQLGPLIDQLQQRLQDGE